MEQCVESGEGFHAPDGFSFVTLDEYFRSGLNLVHLQTLPMVVPAPEPPVQETKVEINVLTSQNLNTQPEGVTPQEPTAQKKQGVKHPHRSKQKKINNIHAIVEEIWQNKGKLAGDDEVLRGEDVLRIHVKTWEGLDTIQDVLEDVENEVEINKIALPFSMKNKFQKKGFIVYLKLHYAEDVPTVQAIFGQHKDAFKKCDVALPSNRTLALKSKPVVAAKKINDVADFDFF